MQIGSIKEGDLVEVDNHGEVLVALVAKAAHRDPGGRRVISLAKDPLPGMARPMRLTATAHQVKARWSLRGRKRNTESPSKGRTGSE